MDVWGRQKQSITRDHILDHSLASRGKPRDARQWPTGRFFFCLPLTHILRAYILSQRDNLLLTLQAFCPNVGRELLWFSGKLKETQQSILFILFKFSVTCLYPDIQFIFAIPFVVDLGSRFIRPYIIKTIWWISFILCLMADIGLKFYPVPSPLPARRWGQGHGLGNFI